MTTIFGPTPVKHVRRLLGILLFLIPFAQPTVAAADQVILTCIFSDGSSGTYAFETTADGKVLFFGKEDGSQSQINGFVTRITANASELALRSTFYSSKWARTLTSQEIVINRLTGVIHTVDIDNANSVPGEPWVYISKSGTCAPGAPKPKF